MSCRSCHLQIMTQSVYQEIQRGLRSDAVDSNEKREKEPSSRSCHLRTYQNFNPPCLETKHLPQLCSTLSSYSTGTCVFQGRDSLIQLCVANVVRILVRNVYNGSSAFRLMCAMRFASRASSRFLKPQFSWGGRSRYPLSSFATYSGSVRRLLRLLSL